MDADTFMAGVEKRLICETEISRFAESNQEKAAEIANKWRDKEDSFYRSVAAFLYGKIDDDSGDSFDNLLKLSRDNDKDVRSDSFLSMGLSKNNRYFLVLAKRLVDSSDGGEKQRIWMALEEMKDPRTLSAVLSIKDPPTRILRRIGNNIDPKYEYRFIGSRDMLLRAKKGNTIRACGSEIIKYGESFEMVDETYPHTYVILPNGKFYLGDRRTEHVNVARGENVLAAGEVVFWRNYRALQVKYINNRSNGYYPGSESEKHLEDSLKEIVDEPPTRFTEVFPKNGFFDEEFLSQFKY